jgi:hypothetical protein
MPDTLFVQFYSRSPKGYFDLSNGFSDTFDICRERGSFFWQEHEPDSSLWHDEATYADRPLPIRSGSAYVSASYMNHLHQAYVWALEYPDIRFVVGGPVAAARKSGPHAWEPLYFDMREDANLPANLRITGRSVEEELGLPNFSGRWKLEIPDQIPPHAPVYISYTLDNGCYWGRCIYCNIKEAPCDLFRKRPRLDFGFERIAHPGRKIVRLNTGSMTPRYIREVIGNLPKSENIEYRTFMRASRGENLALKRTISEDGFTPPKITIGIGVEFPSDRMLAYMDKGIKVADILETLRICKEYGIRVNGNLILGWENLAGSDIGELERFLDEMPADAMSTIQLRWLFAHPRTPIHDEYAGEPLYFGPFYLGFKVSISRRAKERNREALRLLEAYLPEKGVRIEGLANVRQEGDV